MNELTLIEVAKAMFVARYQEFTNKAKAYFAYLPPEAKDEAVAATLYLVWRTITQAVSQGKDVTALMTSIFWFALRQTRSGRTIRDSHFRDVYRTGSEPMSGINMDGFVTRKASVLETIIIRVDTQEWLETLSQTQRDRALDLATGMTTTEASEKWGVSEPAVSQVRVRLYRSYLRHSRQ